MLTDAGSYGAVTIVAVVESTVDGRAPGSAICIAICLQSLPACIQFLAGGLLLSGTGADPDASGARTVVTARNPAPLDGYEILLLLVGGVPKRYSPCVFCPRGERFLGAGSALVARCAARPRHLAGQCLIVTQC